MNSTAITGIPALRPTDAGIPTTGVGSFGWRRRPDHIHQGVDMQARRGAPVRSVADGVVTHASNSLATGFSGYGRHVVVKQGDSGPWFLFAHLEQASVRKGDDVVLGQQLGTVGDSCFSRRDPAKICSGVHLHFEVSPTKYHQDSEAPRLDPVAWLTRNAHRTPAPARTRPARRRKPGEWVFLLPVVLIGGFFFFLTRRLA